MPADKGMKISFCTTCRGADYLERLKETLPENLKRNTGAGNHNNVEFVVVAYGDPNVTQWLKTTFPEEIKSGIIRAVDVSPQQSPFFKMAHAKNVAHRMATGDVLCNLDCDNIAGNNFAGWLNKEFSRNPDIVASVSTRDKFIAKLATGKKPSDITGRVAISRDNFEKLHGYDERHNAAKDSDDVNLKERAYAIGLKPVSVPTSQYGRIISHSDESRHAHMSPEDIAKSQGNFQSRGNFHERIGTVKRVIWGENRVLPPDITGAQPDGDYGCCEATLIDKNLEPQPVSLQALPHPQWQASYRPGGMSGANTR